MIEVNENYQKLKAGYLFVEIARRVEAFKQANPDTDLIKLGIGDVTLPLSPSVVKAFTSAAQELGDRRSFRGYGPEQGYAFLREAIAAGDYADTAEPIGPADIFVSDGSKCDTGNFQELFSGTARIAVPDPVYPVYVDSNVMAGRAGEPREGGYSGLHYLPSHSGNGYLPEPPKEDVDLIYLCFPNNPTGACASRALLERWVAYAQQHKALILFDAAYAEFVRDSEIPRSIYEIPGATEVAVEFRSFSKTAGFTGTRCAYTVVPEACRAFDESGRTVHIREMWNRRQSTKFNGVSYPVQRAAEAVYSDAGQREVREMTDYYLANAHLIVDALQNAGFDPVGGKNSPYVWVPTGGDSWDFFDRVLNEAGVVITPGDGFGSQGKGHVRISAFNDRAQVEQALERIVPVLAG